MPTRLSPAALETLAIVAYRQPVTKGGVERIRGVDSDYTIRALLHRRLIVELGRSDSPGRPYLYGTDFEFLERFGMTSLDELPPLDADVAARLVEAAAEPAPGRTTSDDAATRTRRPDGGRCRPRGSPVGRRSRSLMAPERIQKVIAAAGFASRREAERLIAAGRVTVDGRVAHPRRVGRAGGRRHRRRWSAGRRGVGPRPPRRPQADRGDLHDPRPARERTVLDLVPRALAGAGRLYPVGRLDQDSEGLILLTNDGAWADRVLHPRFGVEREYAIGLAGACSAAQQVALRAGIRLDEGHATLGHLRAMTGDEVRLLVDVLDPPPPRLVWYRATLPPGLEAPAPADVRRRRVRRSSGSPGSGSGLSGSARSGRAAVRPLSAAEVRSLGAGRVQPGPMTDPATGRLPRERRARRASPGRRRPRRAGVVGQEQRRAPRPPRARLPVLRHRSALPRR